MIIHNLIAETTKKLENIGVPSARLDAEVLLAFLLDCDRTELIKYPEKTIHDEQLSAFNRLVERRLRWEPIAYITGRKAFWSFVLDVSPDVLIPRPDTEIIVEETLALCRSEKIVKPRILEIGTGSGAIALALAIELPGAQIMASDISTDALRVAKKNARDLGLESKITFIAGDLLDPVEGAFDIILSNPPYIGAEEYETLPAGVKNYEPSRALLAGQTGLEFYEKLVYQSPGRLNKNGWILLEIGARQAEDVYALMSGLYDRIEVRTDYAGLCRVIKGRRK